MDGGIFVLEKYNKYKLQYDNYIILIKNGGFFIALNDDCMILNKIFTFKIIEGSTFVKVGFPVNSLSKILSNLTKYQINYIVVDDDIVMMDEFKDNKYGLYRESNNYKIYFDRINRISSTLKSNISKDNFSSVLEKLEKDLCEII